jgi:ribosomal protein L7/L12
MVIRLGRRVSYKLSALATGCHRRVSKMITYSIEIKGAQWEVEENVRTLAKSFTSMVEAVIPAPTPYRDTLTLKQVSEVIRIASSNKIGAIKLVRELTGIGLKEAKDLVEGCYGG